MIFRVNKTKNYTVMSNAHLQDRELSLKAKGLLSVVLSLPDEWNYSIAGLTSICKENETAIKTALSELKDAGYLQIIKKKPNETTSGRFEYVYEFYETRQNLTKQDTEKQGIEILPVETIPLNKNTNEENTKRIKENERKNGRNPDSYTEILDQVPLIKDNPELKETFIEFIKMRKLIKAPLTDRALKMIVNQAFKLSNGNPEIMKQIVDQSIRNNYKDVYPLKNMTQSAATSPRIAPDCAGGISLDILIAKAEEQAERKNNNDN